MTFQDILNVASDPSQASVLAAGAGGVFSAEVNNLEKQASVQLSTWGSYVPAPFRSSVDKLLAPVQQNLTTLAANQPSGTVLGLSYTNAALAGIAIFFLGVFAVVKAAR